MGLLNLFLPLSRCPKFHANDQKKSPLLNLLGEGSPGKLNVPVGPRVKEGGKGEEEQRVKSPGRGKCREINAEECVMVLGKS